MAELVNGGDGVAVSVAGLDLTVVEGRAEDGLGGGDALERARVFAAIDGIAGESGVGDGLPTEVDCGFSAVGLGGGDGGEAGGDGGRKDVLGVDADGRGEFAGELDGLAVERDAGYALGSVLIGLAEANVFVECAVGEVSACGGDEERLVDGLGGRGEQAFFGLGGGRGEEMALEADSGGVYAGVPAEDDAGFADFRGEAGDGSRGFAGEDDGGIGEAGGAAVAIFQVDKVAERAGIAGGERGRECVSECGVCAGGEKEFSAGGVAAGGV